MAESPVDESLEGSSSPSTPMPQNGSLYVGDLNPATGETDLFTLFGQLGQINSVRVCRDALTRRSLGYAYVNYASVEDAVKAIKQLNNHDVHGRVMRVMPSQRDPSQRKSGVGNTFIKNLSPEVDNKALYDLFAPHGRIVSCKLATDYSGASKGHGFVQFEDDASMQRAIEAVNGQEVKGQQVFVGPFRRREDRGSPTDKFTNLYVKGLHDSVDENMLREVFGVHGAIVSTVVMRDEADNKPRGFGFVNFETTDDAHAALSALHGHAHAGTQWEVTRAQKKAEREAELRAKFEQEQREKQDKLADSNLYIKNLDDKQDDDSLRKLFEDFGTILSCRVLHDPVSNVSRGVGFVQLSTPEEATRAISELNNKMINGKPLYVAIAQKKQDRQRRLRSFMQQPQGGFMPPTISGAYYGSPQMSMGYSYPGAMNGQAGMPRPYGSPQMGLNMRPPMGAAAYYGMPQMGGYGMQQMGMGYGVPQGRGMQRGRMGGAGPPGRMGQGGRGGYSIGPGGGGGMDGQYGAPYQQGGASYMPGLDQAAGSGMGAGRGGGAGAGPQMNGHMGPRAASAINALPRTLPGQTAALPLSAKLAHIQDPEQRRLMLGEELYPQVHALEPALAAKITGMLLEMSEADVLGMLEDRTACKLKVQEAKTVLIDSGHVPTEDGDVSERVAGLSVS